MRKLSLMLGITCMAVALCTGCSSEEKKPETNEQVENNVEENEKTPDENKGAFKLQEFKTDKIGEEVQIGEFDLDLDGTKDTISIKATEDEYVGVLNIVVKVNDATFEQEGTDFETAVYTFSIDDKNVLFALFDGGMSNDPCTHFYKYANGKIEHVGEMYNDIRCAVQEDDNDQVVVENGVIKWRNFIGIGGVTPVLECKWDGNKFNTEYFGEFDMLTDEEYYTTKKDFKVSADYNNPSQDMTIKANQQIKITKAAIVKVEGVSDVYMFVEAEDGTKGWTTSYEMGEEEVEGFMIAG